MSYSYLRDSKLDTLATSISQVSADENGSYFVFEDTIFHPKGGGQLGDFGYVKVKNHQYEIKKVLKFDTEIRHYAQELIPEKISFEENVFLTIDVKSRALNSRLHSAGHLLDYVVNEIQPEWACIKGHHYPGEAYLEFDHYIEPEDKERWCQNVQHKVNEVIQKGMTVSTWEDANYRSVQFGGYPAEGCGGTHVSDIKEIGYMTIKKVRFKKGRAKLSYDVKDACD